MVSAMSIRAFLVGGACQETPRHHVSRTARSSRSPDGAFRDTIRT
jgi:hypothetical protein